MTQILVTGASGQMGQAMQSIAHQFEDVDFVFLSSKLLDISSIEDCDAVFNEIMPDICVNFAAYTQVDKAEDDKEIAFRINAEGCENLARMCLKYNAALVHISTDFVFDGEKNEPYTITDRPNPINVYGASKLKGEHYIQELLEQYYIVRTSWVYSDFGHNFKKRCLV